MNEYPDSEDTGIAFSFFGSGESSACDVDTTRVWHVLPNWVSVTVFPTPRIPLSNSLISACGSVDAGSHVDFSCPSHAT